MLSSDLCQCQAPKCSTDIHAGKIYVHMKKKIIEKQTQNPVTKMSGLYMQLKRKFCWVLCLLLISFKFFFSFHLFTFYILVIIGDISKFFTMSVTVGRSWIYINTVNSHLFTITCAYQELNHLI